MNAASSGQTSLSEVWKRIPIGPRLHLRAPGRRAPKTRNARGAPSVARVVSMRSPLLYCSKPAPFSTSQTAAGAMPRAAQRLVRVATVPRAAGGGRPPCSSGAAISGGACGGWAARQPTPAAATATDERRRRHQRPAGRETAARRAPAAIPRGISPRGAGPP